ESLKRAEQGAEPPRAPSNGDEKRRVQEREPEAEPEVQQIADRAGAAPVLGHRRAEQEREIHARQAQFAGPVRDRRQNERPDEAARNRGKNHRMRPGPLALRPDPLAPMASSMATAALMSARCTSACGKLPRNCPV